MTNIIQAIEDENLFAPWFRNRETWSAWEAFLLALFALPMNRKQRQIFESCTCRNKPPIEPSREAWLVVGRRGGKSFVVAIIAVYLACFRDYSQYLTPGECGTVMVLAADRKQARVILRYITALLENVPMLARLIQRKTTESVELANRMNIEIHSASFRAVRGYTVVAAICDEIAFWRSDDSANPDTEILAALRPAMATIPGAILLCLSSPYAKRGELWTTYRQHFSKDDSAILVWQAETRAMNPTVPQSFIDEAYKQDSARATAEYGAQFRSDIENYISREAAEACVTPGVRELLYISGNRYVGFVDPSGGSCDSMTLAIAHKEGETAILDCVREVKPPFSPEAVVKEFSTTLKDYHIRTVSGDRYGGEWPREQFRKQGVEYRPADRNRSDLYRDLLPLINSGSVALLDNDLLINQLVGLERRTGRGGRDSIDHAPGAHDDLINAVAGAVCLTQKPTTRVRVRSVNMIQPWREFQ